MYANYEINFAIHAVIFIAKFVLLYFILYANIHNNRITMEIVFVQPIRFVCLASMMQIDKFRI